MNYMGDAMALDKYSMHRFVDANITEPSQRRYLQYFATLLNGSQRIQTEAVTLADVRLVDAPVTPYGLEVKIYERLQCVYTAAVK